MEKQVCDCDPECCKTSDTTYHFHIGNDCFHQDGSTHEICDSL